MRSRFASHAKKRARRATLLARAPRGSPTIERQYVRDVRRVVTAFHSEIARAVEPQYRQDDPGDNPDQRLFVGVAAWRSLAQRARAASDAFRATAFQTARRHEKYSKAEAVRTLGERAADLAVEVRGFAERFAADAVTTLHGFLTGALDDAEEAVNKAALGAQLGEEQGTFTLDNLLEGWLGRALNSATNAVTQSTAELNQTRQEDVGVTAYVWIAMRDAKTRPAHAALDGQECSWDDPPLSAEESSSGEPCAPGDDYNCRCLASPIVNIVAEPETEDEAAA